PGEQQPPAPDAVAEGAHRDQRPGDEEAVDVGDPQQLGAARAQRLAERRDREDEHREVHRDDQRREHERGERGPLAASRPDGVGRGHRPPPFHYAPERNRTIACTPCPLVARETRTSTPPSSRRRSPCSTRPATGGSPSKRWPVGPGPPSPRSTDAGRPASTSRW